MKRLRQKNKREIDLEKKEKGFTLYLNSSYQENKPAKSNKPLRAKTAGAAGKLNNILFYQKVTGHCFEGSKGGLSSLPVCPA